MPEGGNAIPISVRLPADIVARLDRVAAIIERPRSWVILDAVREYLADEGQEVLDIQAGIDEIERGEVVSFEEAMAGFERIVAKAEAKQPKP